MLRVSSVEADVNTPQTDQLDLRLQRGELRYRVSIWLKEPFTLPSIYCSSAFAWDWLFKVVARLELPKRLNATLTLHYTHTISYLSKDCVLGAAQAVLQRYLISPQPNP